MQKKSFKNRKRKGDTKKKKLKHFQILVVITNTTGKIFAIIGTKKVPVVVIGFCLQQSWNRFLSALVLF